MRYARVLLLGLLAAALLAAALWLAGAEERGVQASHDPVTAATTGEDVAFDMVVDDDGDTTPDNGPAVLGNIDHCISVAAGASFTFDVVLDGIPVGENLAGFNFAVLAVPGQSLGGLTVTALENGTEGVNILTNEGYGYIFTWFSAEPPAPLEGFGVGTADLGATEEAPPTTVRGVMSRFTVDTSDAAQGRYPMVLDWVGVFNSMGRETLDFDDDDGRGRDQDGDTLVDEDSIVDAYDGYGVIAVDEACPEEPIPLPRPTPTPTATLTPSPTDKPAKQTPTPPPTGTPTTPTPTLPPKGTPTIPTPTSTSTPTGTPTVAPEAYAPGGDTSAPIVTPTVAPAQLPQGGDRPQTAYGGSGGAWLMVLGGAAGLGVLLWAAHGLANRRRG